MWAWYTGDGSRFLVTDEDSGALASILSALRAFPESTSVRERGCYALARLAAADGIPNRMRSLGIWAFPSQTATKLGSWLHAPEESVARLMTADVDMVVGNLMRLAPATDVLLAALACLAVLSGTRTNERCCSFARRSAATLEH